MRVVCALIVAALLMTATPARGEYPDKPVEIVVPFVAGGGTDLISRLVADYLGRRWNQPLLVVNKPGGGGIPGARAALKDARPDGYTALMDIHTTSSMHIGAWKTPVCSGVVDGLAKSATTPASRREGSTAADPAQYELHDLDHRDRGQGGDGDDRQLGRGERDGVEQDL